VLHFFGTRLFDDTAVKRFGTRLKLRQVHGDVVVPYDSCLGGGNGIAPPTGDAWVTNQKGALITVSTADCLSILLIDPDRFVVSAIHSGWRGGLLNIAGKAVATMVRDYQSDPRSIWVGMGPAIGPCCFEVGPDVWQRIETEYRYGQEVISSREGEKAKVDLARLNRLHLLAAGLLPEKIISAGLCTVCHPDLFYSYRRDRTTGPGMISGVMLKV
jgi:YfiH family protein